MAAGILDARPLTGRNRHRIEVLRLTIVRSLKSRYRGSALGVLWAFVMPVLMTGIYTTLFGTALASYYDHSVVRYIISAFVALTIVTFFTQSTAEALVSVVQNGGLLQKIALDPEIFPIASLFANAFQQIVTTFPVLLVVTAFTTHDPLRVLLVLALMVLLLVMVMGFGLALSVAFVYFRDFGNIWSIASFLLWMTSPVFYPRELIPPTVRMYLDWNPIAIAIGSFRDVILGSGPLDGLLMLKFFVAALVCAAGGFYIFDLNRAKLLDRI